MLLLFWLSRNLWLFGIINDYIGLSEVHTK